MLDSKAKKREVLATLLKQFTDKGGVVKRLPDGAAEGYRDHDYAPYRSDGKQRTQTMYYGGDR